MKPRVFLHIGQGKTGTSTIQGFMSKNRADLADRGYLFPALTGNPRHLELSLYAKGDNMVRSVDWWRMPFEATDELRRVVEHDLPAQVAESRCGNVVLSDEALYRLRPRPLSRVVAVLEPMARELVFVIYLRRQDEHIVSRYKQTMREGSTLLLSEFIARPQTVESWQYDTILRRLLQQFPAARLLVRPYARDRFRGGSLVRDFLDAIGADLEPGSSDSGVTDNTSFDAHTTEYLRRHNVRHGRADQRLRQQLTRISDGPDLRMEDEEHRRLWDGFRPSNERLVREFLPDAEDVFLSKPARRSGVTQREVTDADLAEVEARLS